MNKFTPVLRVPRFKSYVRHDAGGDHYKSRLEGAENFRGQANFNLRVKVSHQPVNQVAFKEVTNCVRR